MENLKGREGRSEKPDWYKEIDWNAPLNPEEKINIFYSKTCDDLKDRPGFQRVFGELNAEFAWTHPGPAGDKIYAEWMITRMRKAFPV